MRGLKQHPVGTSLVVQWLRLCTSTVGAAGSIPRQGTKILHAGQCAPLKEKPTKTKRPQHLFISPQFYRSEVQHTVGLGSLFRMNSKPKARCQPD